MLDIALRICGMASLLTFCELFSVNSEAVKWLGVKGKRRSHAVRSATASLSGIVVSALLIALGPHVSGWVLLVIAGLLLSRVVDLSPAGDASDMMLLILLTGIGLILLQDDGRITRTAVEIALISNICLAYFWSGYAKIVSKNWRSGRQLALIINTEMYGNSVLAHVLLDRNALALTLSALTITLEMSAPIFVILGGYYILAWAICAFFMHLSIALIMGLNRFFLTFSAALAWLIYSRF